MAELPQDAAERQEAILAALIEKWNALPDSGFVYGRKRYVEGEKVWEAQFAIENDKGEARARYILVYLIDAFTTKTDAPGRSRRIHYLYHIEINYQFEDERTGGDNSTVGFNALIARGEESFGRDENLGFYDPPGADVNTTGLQTTAPAEVEFVDGVLCHTKEYNIEVTLLAC